VNVSVEDAERKIGRIRKLAAEAGRDPDRLHFSISPGLGRFVDLDAVKRYRDAGVQQIILGGAPAKPELLRAEIERVAERVVVPSARV
jgi:alkanesulfonate monooxygenase SsuD/methylene tetrahydromethanopterin reductase-like flavin-dependent oxidoreductase (luciferase family)